MAALKMIVMGVALLLALGSAFDRLDAQPDNVTRANRALIHRAIYMSNTTLSYESELSNASIARFRHEAERVQASLRQRNRELRSAQADIRRNARRIEALQREIADLEREITTIAEAATAQLARLSRDYSERYDSLLQSWNRLLDTPGGRHALDLIATGDPQSQAEATLILERQYGLRRDAARAGAAQEARDMAVTYLSVRGNGLATTANITRFFEDVVSNDPVACWDRIELGRLYEDANRPREMLGVATAAVRICTDERHRSAALDELGRAQMMLRQFEPALETFQRSFRIREQLAARHPQSRDYQDDVSVSHNQISDLLFRMRRYPDAVRHRDQAVQIDRRLAGADPQDGELQRGLAISLMRLSDSLTINGQLPEALAAIDEAITLTDALAISNPASSRVAGDLAYAYGNKGRIHMILGERETATSLFLSSLRIMEELARGDPSSAAYQRQIGVALWGLAQLSAPGYNWRRVVAHFDAMERRGFLADLDEDHVRIARRNAAAEAGP